MLDKSLIFSVINFNLCGISDKLSKLSQSIGPHSPIPNVSGLLVLKILINHVGLFLRIPRDVPLGKMKFKLWKYILAESI